jgi:hypothetical protein
MVKLPRSLPLCMEEGGIVGVVVVDKRMCEPRSSANSVTLSPLLPPGMT